MGKKDDELPDKKKLKKAFYKFSDGAETLTLEQFKHMCYKFKLSPTTKVLKALFNELDKNDDDALSLEECEELVKRQWKPLTDRVDEFLEDLRTWRKEQGKEGYIDKEELVTLLTQESDEAMTQEDIDFCFRELDINKDGKITDKELAKSIFNLEDIMSRAPSRASRRRSPSPGSSRHSSAHGSRHGSRHSSGHGSRHSGSRHGSRRGSRDQASPEIQDKQPTPEPETQAEPVPEPEQQQEPEPEPEQEPEPEPAPEAQAQEEVVPQENTEEQSEAEQPATEEEPRVTTPADVAQGEEQGEKKADEDKGEQGEAGQQQAEPEAKQEEQEKPAEAEIAKPDDGGETKPDSPREQKQEET